jgi:DNA polymerase zeta
MSPPERVLKVQINQIDYTLAPPGSLDYSTLPRVPVIRIYGPSSFGTKTCVHVHQVYPYFFVEYPGAVDPDSGIQYPMYC